MVYKLVILDKDNNPKDYHENDFEFKRYIDALGRLLQIHRYHNNFSITTSPDSSRIFLIGDSSEIKDLPYNLSIIKIDGDNSTIIDDKHLKKILRLTSSIGMYDYSLTGRVHQIDNLDAVKYLIIFNQDVDIKEILKSVNKLLPDNKIKKYGNLIVIENDQQFMTLKLCCNIEDYKMIEA